MAYSQDDICNIALALIPGVGNMLTRQLISYCGSARQALGSTKAQLMRVPGVGENLAERIVRHNAMQEAELMLTQADKNQATLLFFTDKQYPERLKTISDAPALLYYAGTADLNAAKIVSIVGTRKATDYGKQITEDIVAGLVKHNCLIVSGLAYGIDIAAHKAALKHQLPTLGVMASGLDVIYPASHKTTAAQMLEHGGLLTENGFGVKPDAPRFPARNRIIAGMCDAVIVVEAADKGGALITAEIANSYNKDIFAVPGNLDNKYSEGCNQLIFQNKACIYTGLSSFEKMMGWDDTDQVIQTSLFVAEEAANLSDEENNVISLLKQNQALQIDELSWISQIPVSRLSSLLLGLEFQGYIRTLPGKKYALAPKR